MLAGLIEGEYKPLKKRLINEITCKKFHYQIGTYANRNCHIANYYNRNLDVVAQKLRFANKDFKWKIIVKDYLELINQIN